MNLRDAVRISAIALENRELDFSVSFDEKTYKQYIDLFRHDVLLFIPVDYIGYWHQHEDWYYHTTEIRRVKEIIKKGYLSLDAGSEDCGVGQAIYTFPISSGRCYTGNDMVTLKFKSDVKHYHLTGAADSIHALGECVFKEEKLVLNDLEVLSGSELEKDRRNSFDVIKCLYHDFGFSNLEKGYSKDLNFDNLQMFIQDKFSSTIFNENFYSELRKEFTDMKDGFEKSSLF